MDTIVLINKKTDGSEVSINVKLKSPAVKTLLGGKSFTLAGLFDLATEGVVSDENISTNEALDAVSKEDAIEMIQDMVAHKSPFIEVEVQEPKDEKPKDEKPKQPKEPKTEVVKPKEVETEEAKEPQGE
jgi:hypothetical protein